MSQTRLNGRQTRWLIKLLPYDFRIFYRKGALNPADGPSRRPDYLADAEEVDQTPVSQLLPTLSARVARREPQEWSSRPNIGKNSGSKRDQEQSSRPSIGESSSVGENSGSEQDPSSLPAALTAEVIRADGLPTAATGEAAVEGNVQPAEEFPEEPLIRDNSNGAGSLHPASAGSEVSAVNMTAAKEIGILRLQLVHQGPGRDSRPRVDSW
jgi:hypothetical protein